KSLQLFQNPWTTASGTVSATLSPQSSSQDGSLAIDVQCGTFQARSPIDAPESAGLSVGGLWFFRRPSDDAASNRTSDKRAHAGTRAFHDRVHGVLCRVDDLFDHRRVAQGPAGAERDAVRPVDRHPGAEWLAGADRPRYLDRPARRAPRLYADHAGRRGRDLPP